MKKLFLGLLAGVSVALFAVACGSNNNNNPQPVAVGNCANQPNTVWNGSTCVYNANCMNQPGTIWNGQTCVPNQYAGQQYGGYPNQYGGGYNSSCTGGTCINAMNTNGGWGAGYPQGGYGGYPTSYPTMGYPQGAYGGYQNYYYPTYYTAPRAGVYFYGGF